ncbi:EAL domain-containing protein [Candidatus Omnitrophota bacterium]
MAKKHILLIDDEVDFAETLSVRLELRGYQVTVEYSGEGALKKAQDTPDLILLDVMMPVMNGYEVCNRLRQDKATRDIPIIMLTAKNEPKDKVEGLHIGADDYITKSFETEELFARIEALLRRSSFVKPDQKNKVALIKELKQIIKGELVEMVFQPIFYLQPMKLFAYEVLTRGPKDSPLANPEKLFKSALDYGFVFDLEILCRRKTLAKLGKRIRKNLFFFNSNPYIVEAEQIKEILSLYENPEQVVFEVTERAEIKDFSSFCQALSSIKAQGFRISIDDVGSGYSSLDAIAELEPDFVKIDIGLIRDINHSPKKQSLVKAIMMICKQNKILAIGEGIETKEELNTLIEMGVGGGQGYLLGRPNPKLVG